MKANKSNLLAVIIFAGIILSSMEWIVIENTLIAILLVLTTVFITSLLYLKLLCNLLNIKIKHFEFTIELFKVFAITSILILPFICFGKAILTNKINYPKNVIVIVYILIPVIFLTAVNIVEFSPTLRKLKPITDKKILELLKKLERELNVHIDGIYILEGIDGASVNAYLTGLRKFRIYVTEKLLSSLNTEELLAVLAHEVAHAQKKHTLKIFMGSVLIVILEVAVALFLLQKAGIVDSLIIAFSTAWFVDLFFRALNRRLEYEADLIGAKVAGKEAMISALKKIGEISPNTGSEILGDHPLIENRIKKLNKSLL